MHAMREWPFKKQLLLNLILYTQLSLGQTDSFHIVLKTKMTISLPNKQDTPGLTCIRCYKMLKHLLQVKLRTIFIGFNLERDGNSIVRLSLQASHSQLNFYSLPFEYLCYRVKNARFIQISKKSNIDVNKAEGCNTYVNNTVISLILCKRGEW